MIPIRPSQLIIAHTTYAGVTSLPSSPSTGMTFTYCLSQATAAGGDRFNLGGPFPESLVTAFRSQSRLLPRIGHYFPSQLQRCPVCYRLSSYLGCTNTAGYKDIYHLRPSNQPNCDRQINGSIHDHNDSPRRRPFTAGTTPPWRTVRLRLLLVVVTQEEDCEVTLPGAKDEIRAVGVVNMEHLLSHLPTIRTRTRIPFEEAAIQGFSRAPRVCQCEGALSPR